jgi:outer membrane protein assembly factor BamB
MRRTPVRSWVGSVALGAVLLGLVLNSTPAQPPIPAAPPGLPQAKLAEKKPQSLEVMVFPSDRDAKGMIKAVNDYLAEFKDNPKAPWDKICFAAQQVLDTKSDSFLERKSDDGKIQRVSAKQEANRLIGEFPNEGKQFYQLTYGPAADDLLKKSTDRTYDRGQLAELSQRYFHTKAGATATALLASLQLERGNYIEAAYSYERLLARKDADELLTPLTLYKSALAFKRAGGSSAAQIPKLLDQVERKLPRDGLKIGRKAYSFDELKTELDRPIETLFGTVGEAFVTMRYGNASHTAINDGGTPFLDPVFAKSLFSLNNPDQHDAELVQGSNWIQQNLPEVLKPAKNATKTDPVLPGFFPLTTQNLVFVRTYDSIFAYITKDGFSNHGQPGKVGQEYWRADHIEGCLSRVMGVDNNADAKNRWQRFKDQHNLRSLLYENPLLGSMTHDGLNVYAIDDLAIPPEPQNPNQDVWAGFQQPQNSFQTGLDKDFADGNRLKAYDIMTGKLVWELGKPIQGPPLTEEEEDKSTNPLILLSGSFFLGPPLPVNGKLYVLFEKNGRMRLACLDPNRVKHYTLPKPNDDYPSNRVPELVWSQRIGEPTLKLPTDSLRRFQCSYLAYADGVVIIPTNAGAVVALDLMSRSLLWARSYRSLAPTPQVDPNMPALGGRIPRRGMGPQAGVTTLAQDRWRAAAPVITNGRVIFTAFDSDSMDCLDLRTGNLLWTEPRRPGDLYVAGLVDDKMLIVGRESLRAINVKGQPRNAATGAKEDTVTAWKDVRITMPTGHGAIVKGGLYYLPVAENASGATPEVWTIDVKKGEVASKTSYRKKVDDGYLSVGNLVFHEGQLFSQSATELTAFPLMDRKKNDMDRLLQLNPNDPTGLLARGEFFLDKGNLQQAIADFQASQKNTPPADVQDRLRDKLYSAYTELLSKDFAAGEGYLTEYRKLCDVATDAEDPKARQKQIDERFKRQSRYLELLAKGREEQGQLLAAFDHYTEYAVLGANKQLVSLGEEATIQVRPDVWARGRIEQMLRKSVNAGAIQQLKDNAQQEWKTIAAADATKQRAFINKYASFVSVAEPARYSLAKQLLTSKSDDERAEASRLLYTLATSGSDRSLAAQSLELLARSLITRNQLDDAVAMFTTLGRDYTNEKITTKTSTKTSTKTGAEIARDMLTDKRLLPYWEPVAALLPDRVAAKQVSGQAPGIGNVGYSLTVENSEQHPFFRRARLVLVTGESNDGTYVLQVVDTLTGRETARFPKLRYPPNVTPQNMLAQVRGSLLLVQTGILVHCIDLTEKKILWDFNILGDAKLDLNNMPYEVQAGPQNGVPLITTLNLNGTLLNIGRSTILQSNYACIITKDGLTTLDPYTGSKLWTRTNIVPKSIIFGDASHIFIVESESNRAKSRVLRASDGSLVSGEFDFARSVNNPNTIQMQGRMVLLFDPDSSKPAVLRLYDPLKNEDVWKKEFPSGSVVVRGDRASDVGILEPSGKFRVVSTARGEPQFEAQVDAANVATHVKDLSGPQYVSDDQRYYLLLNRNPQSPAMQRSTIYRYGGGGGLASTMITGAVYSFDRSSSKRLWYTDDQLVGCVLFTERFRELPAMVLGTLRTEEGSNQYVYNVQVLDKQNGILRYAKSHPQSGTFYAMVIDPQSGSTRITRSDFHLELSADLKPSASK